MHITHKQINPLSKASGIFIFLDENSEISNYTYGPDVKPDLNEQGIQYGFAITGHILYLFYADISFIIHFFAGQLLQVPEGPLLAYSFSFCAFSTFFNPMKNLKMEAKWK